MNKNLNRIGLFLFLTLGIMLQASAQPINEQHNKFNLGLNLGINQHHLSAPETSKEISHEAIQGKIGLSVGGFFEWNLSSHLTFILESNFKQRRGEISNYKFTEYINWAPLNIVHERYRTDVGSVDINYIELQIPASFQLKISRKFPVFFELGISINSVLLDLSKDRHTRESYYEKIYLDLVAHDPPKIESRNSKLIFYESSQLLGYNLGIGFKKKLIGKHSTSIRLRYTNLFEELLIRRRFVDSRESIELLISHALSGK